MKRVVRGYETRLRLLMLLVLVFAHVVLTAPIVSASPENFRDTFDVVAYDNDDGTLSWDGPWAEVGEAADPETGDWIVTTDLGFPGHAVKKSGQDGNGLLRTADLDGFTSATLRFSYRRERLALNKSIAVQISSSGPVGPWTTVHTISGVAPEATDPLYQLASVDITEHISSSTTVRFMHEERAGAFGAHMAVYVDDVEIIGEQTNRAPLLAAVGSLVVDEGSGLGFVASAADPDGDGLVFSLAGEVPAGASITSDGTFSWIPDESQGPGSYLFDAVVSDTGSPVLTDSQAVTVTVAEVNQSPVLVSPDDRFDGEGASISLALEATDPDLPANDLSWQESGLPPGLTLRSDGVISGTVEDSAAVDSPYVVTVEVFDQDGMSDQDTFTWTVTDTNRAPSQPQTPPVVPDPTPGNEDPDSPDDSLGVSSPPGEEKEVNGSEPPETDDPRPGLEAASIPLAHEDSGTDVEFKRVAAIPHLGISAAVNGVLGAVGLLIPSSSGLDSVEHSPLLGAISLFTKAFFHTILAMDIPTLLLGFAAITLVGLRGVSRYPVLFSRRSQHFWAVVMVGRERRLAVHETPDPNSNVIYKLGPTTQSLRGTGAEDSVEGTRWVGISTPTGEGWVEGWKVTEQVDAKYFLNDTRPRAILEDFLGRLRFNRDVTDLVSERGLLLVLADMIQILDKKVLPQLLSDPADTVIRGGGWSPRDFHLEVVRPLLDASNDTPVISPHVAHAETSLLPSPMRNFRYLALRGQGTQSWLVFFEYSGGKPRIVGLTIDE